MPLVQSLGSGNFGSDTSVAKTYSADIVDQTYLANDALDPGLLFGYH